MFAEEHGMEAYANRNALLERAALFKTINTLHEQQRELVSVLSGLYNLFVEEQPSYRHEILDKTRDVLNKFGV